MAQQTTAQTFCEVGRGWLAFLASKLLHSIAIPVAVILPTSTQSLSAQILKSLSLATFIALDERPRPGLGGIEDTKESQQKGERVTGWTARR